jgi:hypothetical protein
MGGNTVDSTGVGTAIGSEAAARSATGGWSNIASPGVTSPRGSTLHPL